MGQNITEAALFQPLRVLGEQIRGRKLSPVALTEAYLGRLERFGPKLGAVVTILREQALREARAAEKEIRGGRYRGPLHGIPYGAKDLLATRGIPTTWGAEPFRKQVFDHDATVVRKLRDAGAILIAKLAMIELAGGFGYQTADASFTGPCRTPWNTEYWAGGSSSGSGAAVAAGLVAFAIGTETSGSIITPATFCGVSGLRPTYGRVSRHGAMALCWTLDKIGPMCRTVDDCGLVLSAIAGRDVNDPSTASKPFQWPERAEGKKRNWRIGVIRGTTEGIMPAVRENFEAALKVLGRVGTLVEGVEWPDLPYSATLGLILRAEAASAFRELLESGRARELRDPTDRFGGYSGLVVSAVDYLQAQRVRVQIKKALHQLTSRYDALVAPSLATVAYPLNRPFAEAYADQRGRGPALIPACNLAGQPALALPTGLGPNNLPTGMQLIGKAWSEARLLSIAQAYQQHTEWHTRRPPNPA